jgi:hypothetical protein
LKQALLGEMRPPRAAPRVQLHSSHKLPAEPLPPTRLLGGPHCPGRLVGRLQRSGPGVRNVITNDSGLTGSRKVAGVQAAGLLQLPVNPAVLDLLQHVLVAMHTDNRPTTA